MIVSNSGQRVVTSITGALLIALASTAFAAGPPASAPSPPAKEMREKMALVHDQMAACLRSDRPISECRAEMQKSCHDLGNQGCTMMMGMGGGGMMGTGRGMHHRMRSNTPSSSNPPK